MKLCVKLTAKFRPPPNFFRGYKPINTDTSLQLPGTSSAGWFRLFDLLKLTPGVYPLSGEELTLGKSQPRIELCHVCTRNEF